MIKRDILDSYMDVVTSLFNKCHESEKLGKIPLRVSDLHIYLKTKKKSFNMLITKKLILYYQMVYIYQPTSAYSCILQYPVLVNVNLCYMFYNNVNNMHDDIPA